MQKLEAVGERHLEVVVGNLGDIALEDIVVVKGMVQDKPQDRRVSPIVVFLVRP